MSLPPSIPSIPDGLFRTLLMRGVDPFELALLGEAGPMTQALARRYGAIRVDVVREGAVVPQPAEARLLQRPRRGGFWCREIRLLAGEIPRLLGRSVVPPDARRLHRALTGLGDTPLMALLFRDGRLRHGVERRLQRFHPGCGAGPGRLTLYSVQGEPLLLIETLLTRDGSARAG